LWDIQGVHWTPFLTRDESDFIIEKSMSLAIDLQSLPLGQWRTRQAIVFDWYDGPREGVCALAQPQAEVAFELLEERANADHLDDRLFRVNELPAGSVDRILAELTELGSPDQAVWAPVWAFASKTRQREVENRIDDILSRAIVTPIVISTRDMTDFLGCWQVDSAANGPFAALENAQNGQRIAR
jgi:hypothetical protein